VKDLLKPMFSQFKSENLIKEIAFVLKNSTFLPGDYIIYKDSIGEEMYFIVEGSVYIIAEDNQTVLNTLEMGQYFGEVALFLHKRRISFVQAKTYCVVSVLLKQDLAAILKSFPKLEGEFRMEAERRRQETLEIQEIQKQQTKSKMEMEKEQSPEEAFGLISDSSEEDDDEESKKDKVTSHGSILHLMKQ